MSRLRDAPPERLAGFDVTATDLLQQRGQRRTDAVILSGGDDETWVRVVVRPSGTEQKVKSYMEVRCPVNDDLASARARVDALLAQLRDAAQQW
jgi:phosphomannomutase